MSEPLRRARWARRVYRWMLSAHPEEFRREFAGEMLWIFDQEARAKKTAPLFADVVLSLGRQWVLRGNARGLAAGDVMAHVPRVAAGPFEAERILVSEGRLPAGRMIQGGAVAAAFMVVLAFAAVQPVTQMVVLAGQSATAPADGVQKGISGGIKGGVAGGIVGGGSGGVAGGIDAGVAGGIASHAGQGAAETPAQKQFAAWLENFNGGDRAKLLVYLEKNYPDEAKRIDGLMGFRRMTGGFDLKKVEKSEAVIFAAIVKERDSDTFARLEMEVDPAEPHHIVKLDLNMIPTPAELAIPRMSEEQAVAALREEIEKRVAADRFSGAVMVSKNGKTIFSGAYGLADRDKKIKNELDTKFRIGSMNKMFTAVSTLQLVQAGKLKLTGTVGESLPDYPNKDLAGKVTIHELLTHTGGTGDFFGPEFDKHRLELRTLQDYVKLYGARAPEFEPGSRWEYSNYGFLLLGVIVQKVSGQDYYEYVREHVYAPAGMDSTASLSEDEAVAKRSVGYMKRPGSETWTPNTDTLPYRGTSAGGGYSTVEDLQRFAEAVKNHKLLNAEYTEMLTTGKAETGGGAKYAYGFMDQVSGGVRSYGHGGGAPGMNGDLTIYPQSGYVVAVLANLDPPAAQRIANYIGNRLPEK